MYTLYFSKKDKIIKVTKASKGMQSGVTYTEEVTQFNSNYFVCTKRKPLVEKAKEIQQEWVVDLEEELKALKEIKI